VGARRHQTHSLEVSQGAGGRVSGQREITEHYLLYSTFMVELTKNQILPRYILAVYSYWICIRYAI
jgi:hypothetical protein